MDFRYKIQRRRRLFDRQNGRCFYCNGEMAWLDPYPKTGPFPDAMCTLEHLRDRFDPTRAEPKRWPNEERTVAACYRCNTERSRARAHALYPPGRGKMESSYTLSSNHQTPQRE